MLYLSLLGCIFFYLGSAQYYLYFIYFSLLFFLSSIFSKLFKYYFELNSCFTLHFAAKNQSSCTRTCFILFTGCFTPKPLWQVRMFQPRFVMQSFRPCSIHFTTVGGFHRTSYYVVLVKVGSA